MRLDMTSPIQCFTVSLPFVLNNIVLLLPFYEVALRIHAMSIGSSLLSSSQGDKFAHHGRWGIIALLASVRLETMTADLT